MDDFVKQVSATEDSSCVVELVLTHYSDLHENAVAWIYKRVGEVQQNGK